MGKNHPKADTIERILGHRKQSKHNDWDLSAKCVLSSAVPNIT